MSIRLLFVIAAIVCFGLAAAGVPSRVGFQPLGLLFLSVALFLT